MFKLILIFCIFSFNVNASSISIRAIVNNEIITSYDIEERAKLSKELLTLSKISMTDEQIKNKVLSEIIDDKIKIAEAKKYGIFVSKEEINDAMKRMEKYLNLPIDGYKKIIEKIGVDKNIIEEQIEADVIWMKFVYSVLRSYVKISDSDLNIYLDNLKNSNNFEYELATFTIKKDNNLLNDIYSKNIDSCVKFKESFTDVINLKMKDNEMNKQLFNFVSRSNNKPFHFLKDENNYQIFFVCSKNKYIPTFSDEEKEMIKLQIYQSKLDAFANKYFEKIKLTSIIDLKD